MIDFDNIDDWFNAFGAALIPLLPTDYVARIRQDKPRYMEDARDTLLGMGDRDELVDAALSWLSSETIAGYHGSRLTTADLKSIQELGLLPLRASARRKRLARAFETHPRWSEVEGKLDDFLNDPNLPHKIGVRENQVHLTLSRAGLVDGFNHYLTHGSEFDGHVARMLLDDEAYALLTRDGDATVLKFAVPGPAALDAAHPFFNIQDMKERGELPNLVNEFMTSWAFKVAEPDYQPSTQEIDSGLFFRESVPAKWFVSATLIPNEELKDG